MNPIDFDWNPPEIKKAITLCREFLRGKIVYDLVHGSYSEFQHIARSLPLYQGFVEQDLSFFADNFGYRPVAKPGPRGFDVCAFQGRISAASTGTIAGPKCLDPKHAMPYMPTLSGKTQHM